ncbi:MAG: SET domain-containing protein-lysine N-methyltransferase [Spartobacteria bacterium]
MPRKTKKARNPRPEVQSALRVRRSGIHGTGVYTTRKIRKGTRIIEYTGAYIPRRQADNLRPHNPDDPYHTFYYLLENGAVIDAGKDGNVARWINHSCDPNCTTDEEDHRIFIEALCTIYPGEELFYDYSLDPGERRTRAVEKAYACFCGSPHCRGSMLEPK